MLFSVKTPADFVAVERYVATLLSSDDSRCSFLRGEPFTRIRTHAVYRPDDPVPPSPCWGPDGVCVEIKNRLVSVEIRKPEKEEYDSSWAGPVVYDVIQDFHGSYEALERVQGPFKPGFRPKRPRQEDVDDMV
jgi:hypothetical protein